MYMSCQRHAPILFLYIYCMIQYIGRKLQHPYSNAKLAISKSLRSIHLKLTIHTLQPSKYMSCQRHAPILFLYTYYIMILYIGRKLQHPYIKRQSGDFQKFTFDPSKTHNTHSTTIHVYVVSTPCSNFIPVYLLYDTIHTEKIIHHYYCITSSNQQNRAIFNSLRSILLKFTTHITMMCHQQIFH